MLDWFVSTAYAADDPVASTGMMPTMLMFGSIILIWWLIVIRPQANQARDHRKMVSGLKRGDSVITTSGMFGKVAAVEDAALQLEVAKGVKIRFLKDQVARLHTPGADDLVETK